MINCLHAMLCHAMPCHAMPCHAVLQYGSGLAIRKIEYTAFLGHMSLETLSCINTLH